MLCIISVAYGFDLESRHGSISCYSTGPAWHILLQVYPGNLLDFSEQYARIAVEHDARPDVEYAML